MEIKIKNKCCISSTKHHQTLLGYFLSAKNTEFIHWEIVSKAFLVCQDTVPPLQYPWCIL